MATVFSFDKPFNEPLVHQVVEAYIANGHAHKTKKQKTRAEVRGGGKKPWRQKGTGNARAGSIRSPLWRGGGRVFAARPHVIKVKLNKKMYREAMRCILAELNRQERILIVDKLTVETVKTKDFIKQISQIVSFNEVERVLIVDNDLTENLVLSSRNLVNVDVCFVSELNPVSLIKAHRVILTASAYEEIKGWLHDEL